MLIDCFATDKFAVKELAERMGEDVVSLSEFMDSDGGEFFSPNPYVLVLDYDFCFDYNVIERFFSTVFGGSKVLYCLFVGKSRPDKCIDLSKKIARKKNMILFGADCLDYHTLTKDEYFKKLDESGDNFKNVIPLSSFGGVDFPYGAKKRTLIAADENA